MYSREEIKISHGVDWICVILYLVLVFMGLISIYGASYQFGSTTDIFGSARSGSQILWIACSIVLAFIILKLDSSLFDIFAYYIYIAFMALLLLTIFIAPDIRGSRSWIVITDSIQFQPAEFAKFAVALAVSKYLSTYNLKLLSKKSLFTIIGIIFLPFILILFQQETGSALVFTAFVLVLYRAGIPGLVLILGATAVVLFVVDLKYSEVDFGLVTEGVFISMLIIVVLSAFMISAYKNNHKAALIIIGVSALILFIAYLLNDYFSVRIDWSIVGIVIFSLLLIYLSYLAIKRWKLIYVLIIGFAILSMGYVSSVNYLFNDMLQPHHQMRIKVTLGMEQDLRGAGYNVNQSKIAIGSGGFIGKGFLNGTQTKLKYVPEQDTDFIFCTVGEEQGFVGSVVVLLLFMVLILRLIFLAERQENIFGLIYGYSVACILFFHLAINIGMVIGITPVIGIPLPFFSYGGSSLWGFTILLFIFLRIDMSRKRR